jgi:DNA-binding NarL/FixJ family response regulator
MHVPPHTLDRAASLARELETIDRPDDCVARLVSDLLDLLGRVQDHDPRDAAVLGLSPQEQAVLGLMVVGRTNSAIGHELAISPRTVAKHLEHVYRKLDVTNRASAAALWSGRRPTQ